MALDQQRASGQASGAAITHSSPQLPCISYCNGQWDGGAVELASMRSDVCLPMLAGQLWCHIYITYSYIQPHFARPMPPPRRLLSSGTFAFVSFSKCLTIVIIVMLVTSKSITAVATGAYHSSGLHHTFTLVRALAIVSSH